MRPDVTPRNIVITGASSGIGRALALAYAAPGVTLGLFGRNAVELEQTAKAAHMHGAQTQIFVVDITDHETMAHAIRQFAALVPLDLVIANAGISSGSDAQIMDVNLTSTVHTVETTAALMRARGRGQIAIMGSLAGSLPLPFAAAYSASKLAVQAYGTALRPVLARQGIGVTVISPGFVESPMSARVQGPKPLMVSAARAAAIIQGRLKTNPARIAFPWALAFLAALAACLPSRLQQWALRPFVFTVRD